MLSCHCDDYDLDEPGAWAWFWPDDFTTLGTKRGRRCNCCKNLIKPGDICLEFSRVRSPYTEIEERIRGEEITIAPHFLCNECWEKWMNLHEIGYCVLPNESLLDDMADYHGMTGWTPGTGPGANPASAAGQEPK